MGISKKRDGRYVVGKGIVDSNEYKGSAGWRDMVIQYTASGATENSLEYLEYLRDYALYHSGKGEPIIPPNVSIWLSTEDTMKAVEADDISVSGETVSIGAVTWNGSDWTFDTPSSGGGGAARVLAVQLVFNEVTQKLNLSVPFDQILAAINSGTYVYLWSNFDGEVFFFALGDANPEFITFESFLPNVDIANEKITGVSVEYIRCEADTEEVLYITLNHNF